MSWYWILAAAAALIAQFAPRSVFFAVKAVPMLVLVFAAHARRGHPDEPRARRYRLLGLWMSIVGSLVLEVAFASGVVMFTVAQVCYATSVQVRGRAVGRIAFAFAPAFVTFVTMVWLVTPNLHGALRPIVLTYMITETVVIGLSLAAWLVTPEDRHARDMAAGTWAFAISDSLLATNRWVMPIPGADLLIQCAYFVGQWFIARSFTAQIL
jgi:uncharacterized membrane protein YhhN